MKYAMLVGLFAPVLGALLLALLGRRAGQKLITLTSLTISLLCFIDPHQVACFWWRRDSIGGLLGIATIIIAYFVSNYAARQFEGERRSWHFMALTLCLVSCLLFTDVATNPTVLCSSWVATSLCTFALLLIFDPRRLLLSSAFQAARTFLVVDSLLIIGFIAAYWLPIHATWLLVLSAEIAAIGRAGLTLRRSWVVGTVSAPTPVSALLHAGVVNSGALLLFRINSWTGSYIVLSISLSAICALVMFSLAPRINARVDLKGQLAASTVSQMAFMLFALSIGWPLLAFTHLIGHGFYKAVRFMGSGGATAQRARSRRRIKAGKTLSTWTRTFGALLLLLIGGVCGFLLGIETRAVMSVFSLAALSMWWTKSAGPMRASHLVWMIFGAGLVGYSLIVRALYACVGKIAVWNGWQAPWWSLGASVIAVAGATRVAKHRSDSKLIGVRQ